MKGVNWLGVLIALIIGQAVGFLWYGVLFMDRWLALTGVNPGEGDATLSRIYGVLLSLVVSFGLTVTLARLGANTLMEGLKWGLIIAFFFSVSVVAQDWIYEKAPLELVAINASYLLVWITLAGAAIGGVRLGSRPAAQPA